MDYPREGDLEFIGYFDAHYVEYKVFRKSTSCLRQFLRQSLCHGILRSIIQWPSLVLRLNTLLLDHDVLKYYGLASNSKIFN